MAINFCIVKCHGFTRINGTFSVWYLLPAQWSANAYEKKVRRRHPLFHTNHHISAEIIFCFVLVWPAHVRTHSHACIVCVCWFVCLFVYMDLSSGFLKMIISRPESSPTTPTKSCLKCILITHNIDTNSFAIQYNTINSHKCFIFIKGCAFEHMEQRIESWTIYVAEEEEEEKIQNEMQWAQSQTQLWFVTNLNRTHTTAVYLNLN